MKIRMLLFAVCALQIINLNAQPIAIQALEGTIIFDGKVDDPAWQKITPFPLVTHWPQYGNEPSDPYQVRVAYDNNFIYVSGSVEIEADSMFAASFKRDLFTMGTDYLTIILDTFNDNENGLYFSTTPTGTRTDVAFSEDSKNVDESWDTFWDAESHINDKGWSAEMRIPFASLGFQTVNDVVEMGMMVHMYSAKKYEFVTYPAIEPNWGFWSWAKSTQFQKVTFKNIESSNPIYVTPYILGGVSVDRSELNDDEDAYIKNEDVTRTLGLDVRYNITDNLTLDLSVNTDFAQVEADDQQVNLTRFNLFFPEKRRFFLERANIFDFGFSGFNRLFYTRRIGINSDNENVDVLGGARLAGRLGSWDVGILNVQTNKLKKSLAENFTVARLKRQVLNPNSFVGGMITNRANTEGSFNFGVGLDGLFNIYGSDFLSYSFVQTYTDSLDSSVEFGKGSRVRLRWEKRSYTGFAYDLSYERAGESYNPAMGFEAREDFGHLNNTLSMGWAEKGHPIFQRHQIGLVTDIYTKNSDNTIETIEINPYWTMNLISSLNMNYGISVVHDNLSDSYDLTDSIYVEKGKYDFVQMNAGFSTPGGREVTLDGGLTVGEFFDGNIFSLYFIPKWIASKFLELTATYEYNYIDFEKRDQTFENHISRIKALITLNTKLSFSTFLQYNSIADNIFSNARFRFNPSEGHDLYIVYNELYNSDRRRYDPVRPLVKNRTLLAKYTYTFTY